jgi:soluble lytic murein transglycosylase
VRPELSEVRNAVEHGDESSALELFEAALAGVNPANPERMRWHLWLAYAYQKRNDCSRAIAHFAAASVEPWPLADYARFGAAQCRAALGFPEDALAMLGVLQAESPLNDSVKLLRAQILSEAGALGSAIEIWRDFLKNHGGASPEHSIVSLNLAQALYSSAPPEVDSGLAAVQTDTEKSSIDAVLKEALALLDSANLRDLDANSQERAFVLKQAIVAKLFATDPVQQQQCKTLDQLDELELLVERRDFTQAQELVAKLLADVDKASLQQSAAGCRAHFAAAQVSAGRGAIAEAQVQYETVVRDCTEPEELVARSLFAVARRWQELGDAPAAIAKFEMLERRFPKHRLADDARLREAFAYLELGSEAKFTDLILRMVDDFPEGDMTAEGLFQLALRHMIKGNWSGAVSLLSQLGRLPRIARRDDIEQAERQLYFLARAQYQMGQRELALSEFDQLVRERPFSYYMLQAHTRLLGSDTDRAFRTKASAATASVDAPFSVPYQPKFDTPGFTRALELMAVGEIDRGAAELKALQLSQEVEPLLLWTRAAFEAAAGSLKNSQRLVRERMRDWPRRWPVGAWEPAWKVAFPQPFLDIVVRESARTRVPQSLAYAVMREESQFDRDAVSGADAVGLMQLILPTAKLAARDLGITANALSLKRPAVNVALGCQVLAKLLQRFKTQPVLAIPAYNAGPGRPSRWLKEKPDMDFDLWVEAIPFAETRTYFKHVLASWATYAWLYERDNAEAAMKLPLRLSGE